MDEINKKNSTISDMVEAQRKRSHTQDLRQMVESMKRMVTGQ